MDYPYELAFSVRLGSIVANQSDLSGDLATYLHAPCTCTYLIAQNPYYISSVVDYANVFRESF
jgi:hypothetical protein